MDLRPTFRFNGFAVVDFASRKEINRIKLPDLPPGKSTFPEGGNESHGMAATADGKMLVVNSRLNLNSEVEGSWSS